MKGLFITGTDTGCGKTRVACALARGLRGEGLRVAPFKPVAAGAERTPNGLRNEDARALIEACGGDWPYSVVNPICLEGPVSPHLAARAERVQIQLPALVTQARALAADADLLLTEGAGGWLVPIDDQLTMEDLAVALGLPVVLVVGLRLGCLNHALLTAARLRERAVRFIGWIGSVLDPDMECLAENVDTLKSRLPAPLLGLLPHGAPDEVDLQGSVIQRLAGAYLAGRTPSDAF